MNISSPWASITLPFRSPTAPRMMRRTLFRIVA